MKKLFFALFAVFAVVVIAVLATPVKQSNSPPVNSVIITEDEEAVNSFNVYAMAIVSSPAQEGRMIEKEDINFFNQSSLTLATPATREGCVLENDAYVMQNSTTQSPGFLRGGRCHIFKFPTHASENNKTYYA